MIDIRIRVSRKLVFWIVTVLFALFVLSYALMTLGHSSGGMKLGPVQTQPDH